MNIVSGSRSLWSVGMRPSFVVASMVSRLVFKKCVTLSDIISAFSLEITVTSPQKCTVPLMRCAIGSCMRRNLDIPHS